MLFVEGISYHHILQTTTNDSLLLVHEAIYVLFTWTSE